MDPLAANFQLNFVNRFENAENQLRLRLEYRLIRDNSNPFEIPDERFVKLFRLNKFLVMHLLEEVQEFVDPSDRINKTPPLLQLLVALNFFGTGGFQTNVGQDLNIGLSQPAVSRCINEVADIFAIHLLPRYVQFPTTPEQIHRIKQGFVDSLHFPNTIGAIDCTHVAIYTPKDTPNNPTVAYLNRKGYFSINVQAICDANMIFFNANARYPGATHDAAIWQTSVVNHHLRANYEAGDRNSWLIGDSGYPIQPWMMTPIPDAAENTPEGVYTRRHCAARNVIERAFGVLKQRFKCLMKTRVLYYKHGTAGKIIYACMILHNICRKFDLPDIDDFEEDDDDAPDDDDNIEAHDGQDINILTEGRLIRRNLINLINNN